MREKILKTFTVVIVLAIFICAGVIMFKQLGIVEEYDFGLGAYYYADIPGFDKIMKEDVFITEIPLWIHIILFLGWGFLMYRLWCWIEKKGR